MPYTVLGVSSNSKSWLKCFMSPIVVSHPGILWQKKKKKGHKCFPSNPQVASISTLFLQACLSHVTCCDQRNISIHDAKRDLKSTWGLGIDLLLLLEAGDHHRIQTQAREGEKIDVFSAGRKNKASQLTASTEFGAQCWARKTNSGWGSLPHSLIHPESTSSLPTPILFCLHWKRSVPGSPEKEEKPRRSWHIPHSWSPIDMMTLSPPVDTPTPSLFLLLRWPYNGLFVTFNFPKTLLPLFQRLSRAYKGRKKIHGYTSSSRGEKSNSK